MTENTAISHDPYAALRVSGFRWYMFGMMSLTAGQQMLRVAVGWEIYERTQSALHLGYVGLAQFLPLMVFAVVAGHVTDTYSRKRVLLVALAFTSLATAGLAWNSARNGSVAAVYALLFLVGTARAFWNPARAALLPRIVPRSTFSNAASWNSSGVELSSMIGPAIGGILIGAFGNTVIVYTLSSFAAAAFLIALLKVPYRHQALENRPLALKSMSAGLTFIRQTKTVMAAMILDMFAVLLGAAVILMPVYAKDILQAGPQGLGWLMAAPSIGAFSMAMAQAHRPYRKAGRALLAAVFGFGAAIVLFGLSTNFWLSLVMLYIVGACDNVSVVIRQTLIQLETPDEMRGRISALHNLFVGTSNELGGFRSGIVAGLFGPVISVVSGGLGTILVVLAVAHRWPELRAYGMLKGTG